MLIPHHACPPNIQPAKPGASRAASCVSPPLSHRQPPVDRIAPPDDESADDCAGPPCATRMGRLRRERAAPPLRALTLECAWAEETLTRSAPCDDTDDDEDMACLRASFSARNRSSCSLRLRGGSAALEE